jgi:hypothetical protein
MALSGNKHPLWKGGKCKHTKGYIQFSAGELRNQLEHIVIAKEAWGNRIPWNRNFEVHHIDWKRDHNCRCNLLILHKEIHHGISGCRKKKK